MSPENFIYWLQGFLEIQNPQNITETQVQIIKDHIALVLKKETPVRTLEDMAKKYNICQNLSLPYNNPVSC